MKHSKMEQVGKTCILLYITLSIHVHVQCKSFIFIIIILSRSHLFALIFQSIMEKTFKKLKDSVITTQVAAGKVFKVC